MILLGFAIKLKVNIMSISEEQIFEYLKENLELSNDLRSPKLSIKEINYGLH